MSDDISAILNIELTMYGWTSHAKVHFNWQPGPTGVDDRILDWIREAAEDCKKNRKDL